MRKIALFGLLGLLLAASAAEANGAVAFRGRFGFHRRFAVVTPRVRVINTVGFVDPAFTSFNSFGVVNGFSGGFVDPGFTAFDPGFVGFAGQPDFGFGFAVRRRGFAFGFGSPFVGFNGFNRFGGGFHRGRVFIR